MRIGINDDIVTPFNPNDLLQKVARYGNRIENLS